MTYDERSALAGLTHMDSGINKTEFDAFAGLVRRRGLESPRPWTTIPPPRQKECFQDLEIELAQILLSNCFTEKTNAQGASVLSHPELISSGLIACYDNIAGVTPYVCKNTMNKQIPLI